MLQLVAVVVATLALTAVEAFVPALGASGLAVPMTQQRQHAAAAAAAIYSRHRRTTLGMKYVPDGLTPEQWKKMQKEDAEKKKKMGNLGQVKLQNYMRYPSYIFTYIRLCRVCVSFFQTKSPFVAGVLSLCVPSALFCGRKGAYELAGKAVLSCYNVLPKANVILRKGT